MWARSLDSDRAGSVRPGSPDPPGSCDCWACYGVQRSVRQDLRCGSAAQGVPLAASTCPVAPRPDPRVTHQPRPLESPSTDRAPACPSSPCFVDTWMLPKPKRSEHPSSASPGGHLYLARSGHLYLASIFRPSPIAIMRSIYVTSDPPLQIQRPRSWAREEKASPSRDLRRATSTPLW